MNYERIKEFSELEIISTLAKGYLSPSYCSVRGGSNDLELQLTRVMLISNEFSWYCSRVLGNRQDNLNNTLIRLKEFLKGRIIALGICNFDVTEILFWIISGRILSLYNISD